jgi:hypothetical protein
MNDPDTTKFGAHGGKTLRPIADAIAFSVGLRFEALI